MTSRSTSALRKSAAQRKAATIRQVRGQIRGPGKLPEWNLADLYSGIDAPEVARDLQKMDADCVAFETDYKGKLAEGTAREDGGKWLAEAVRRYEAIDDLAGRLGSYAGLVHAGDSVDPAISKFYGDVSERLTNASVHLLFFALELNRDRRCRDRACDADAGARRITGRGSRICARTSRISSRIASSSCFTKNPRAAMPPGTGCSTRPSPACASRSGPRSWRSSRR